MELNNLYVILLIISLIIVSGCDGTNTGNTTPTLDPKPAQNAIAQAQSFLQSVQTDLSAASAPVDDAQSKGVETTSSRALISNLQAKLSSAGNILNEASNEFNNQNYQQAKADAEQSISIMQDVQNQLGQIKQAVENDYKSTAAKYKPQLIEAERQYRIGEKYIESVESIGADVTSQKTSLQDITAKLNQAKESYRNNYFIGLSEQIKTVVTVCQQVQRELTDIYFNTLVLNAINTATSQIKSKEAMTYMSDATSFRIQKNYQEAVISINKALLTENLVDISSNINKLKQAINDMGLTASFQILDNEANSIRLHISNGDFDNAKKEIDNIKIDIATVADEDAKVADANKIIEDTSNLSFWWAKKPDISASNAKLAEAKKFLAKGDHKSASDKAIIAIDMVKNERKAFWNKVKSDHILGSLYDLAHLLIGDPEKYEQKNIEMSNFEWKTISASINIQFDKPIADISNIVIEDPGTPVSPTIKQVSQATTLPKKPIYFELNPGNPTSCGQTCRQTTATLTNTGDDTAHNVKVNLNIYNNVGDSVYSTQESIGDIPGGQSKSETVTINADCGFLYSNCVGHMPLTLKADVIFDEGTQSFPDQQFSG